MTSSHTTVTYERAINRVRVALKAADGLDFLNDTAAVFNWIDNAPYSLNSRKTHYIAIYSTLKKAEAPSNILDIYKARMDALNKEASDKMKEQKLSPAEEAKYMEWPDILETREKIRLAIHDIESFQDYLIVCLYTMVRPMRLDYAEMQIVSEEPAEHGANYLIWSSKPYFFFTDYKTYTKYGVERVVLSPELCDVIREWQDLVDDSYLLMGLSGLPMKDWELGQRIISIFEKHANKSVGVNILRHSHSSWMRRGELSFKESAELARQMGHSQQMSALYRRI